MTNPNQDETAVSMLCIQIMKTYSNQVEMKVQK